MKPRPTHEGKLLIWDLLKSYGEFNLLFENLIEEYRNLLIQIIRISYNYHMDVDDFEEEFQTYVNNPDKILLLAIDNLSGAMGIVESCRSTFCELKSQQVEKLQKFQYYVFNDDIVTIEEKEYDVIIRVFNKSIDLIKLRNRIIHTSYYSTLIPEYFKGYIEGIRHHRTPKGYNQKKVKLTIEKLEGFNDSISILLNIIFHLKYRLSEPDVDIFKLIDTEEDIKKLKKISFSLEDDL